MNWLLHHACCLPRCSALVRFPFWGRKQASAKLGVLYLITRSGYLYLFDLTTASLIYSENVTPDSPVFVSTFNEKTNGILGVNTRGTVYLPQPWQPLPRSLVCAFIHCARAPRVFT